MPMWLQDGLATVVSFVPRLALFLVILIIGWIVAKLLRKLVAALLAKVGFDRALERGGFGSKIQDSKYKASDVAGMLVYYAVLLFALQLAFGVFGPNPVSELITGIIAFLPKLFFALLIVVVGSAIAGAVADLIRGAAGGLSSARIMATVAQVFIIALAVIAALNQMGIAITVTMPVLITVLGTVGGIAIVGVGGGLIGPMRQRWERWLAAAERETARAKAQAATQETGPGATVPEARSPEPPASPVTPGVDAQSR
ncbi:mechanosensitive ion channel family protein [Pseudonocardia acaciae]|uniref:mechanosensitive ion channel family protein n=1 Tax=Pseudonocardia acaciae TaxID=551276 RepID=UPI00048E6446